MFFSSSSVKPGLSLKLNQLQHLGVLSPKHSNALQQLRDLHSELRDDTLLSLQFKIKHSDNADKKYILNCSFSESRVKYDACNVQCCVFTNFRTKKRPDSGFNVEIDPYEFTKV